MPETDRASQRRGLTGILRSRAVFSYRDRHPSYLIMNLAGAIVVGFTLLANLSCGLPNIAAEAEAEPAQGGAA